MELIITEERRKRNWYYSNDEYISTSGDIIHARIKGKNLTNPETLRQARLMTLKRMPINTRGLYRIEPDPVTTELWNDWQRRQSVGQAEIIDKESQGSSQEGA